MKSRSSKRTAAIIAALIIVNIAVMLASVALGSVKLSLKEIITGLFSVNENDGINAIVGSIRLPRMLGALLAGIAFAVSGLLLQTVTDNKLCAPNIIGINSGAGFFVMLLLCVFPTLWRFSSLAAFIGAILVAFAVMGIAGRLNRGKTETLILAGVAVSSLFSAGISFLSVRFPDALGSYASFSVGGFSGVYLDELLIPAIIIVIFTVFAAFLSPKLNTLCLGDSMARTLGTNVSLLRTLSVTAAAALSAAAVSFAGLIGFVGLIVPNLARRLVGSDVRKLLPTTALLGSAILTLSDLLGRILIAPSEIPSGIIMSFLGVPFFLFLLLKRRGNK